MLRDDRLLNTIDDQSAFLERLAAWRQLSGSDQARRIVADQGPFEPNRFLAGGRLRVGLLCPCLGLGGAEVWQLALARSVDQSRIAWTGAVMIEGRGLTESSMAGALRSFMPIGQGWEAARTLAAASDVVVTWAVTDFEALLQGIEPPPSVVMACHFPGESPWGPGTEEMLRPIERFVAVSELAVDSTPLSVRDRIDVIWNAIDPDRLAVHRVREAIRAGWDVPVQAPVVGYIGRLSPEKDPHALLRLAAELPDPWHVVIVGDGRERDRLQREVESKALTRVRVVGGDPAVGDLLHAFETLVVPSRYESFGLSLAEGLWAGLPVIATRSGLARLVPGLVREIPVSASGRQLFEALQADLTDPDGTLDRVRRGRNFARERLGLDRFGREWTEILVRLRTGGQGGRT